MPKLKTRLLEGVVLDSENPKVVNEYNQGGASVTGSVCVHEDHDVKTVAEVLAGMKTGLLGPGWSGASARRQGTGEITVAVHSTEHSVLPHDESSVIGNSGMHVVSTRTNIIGGTHAGRYETAQPVLKFYARRPAKKRENFLVGERTNERCTVVSETVKIDETYNVLALEAVKVKSLDVGLPAASVTAGEQLHPSGGIMLDDDPHSVKQKSISQINGLIEVCKCQKVAGKSAVAGSVAYIIRTNDVLKSCNDALRKSKGMELKRCWIDHPFPNELKISGAKIKAMMKPGAEVNTRQFEIFRRLVYSEDKKLYAPGSLLRLQRVLHLSFAGKVLAGEPFKNDVDITASLVGMNGKFDLRTCRMVMAPHFTVEGYYILYVLNMASRVCHVFDPSHAWQLGTTLEKRHFQDYMVLLKGMSSLINSVYPGFHLDVSKWTIKCHGGSTEDRVKRTVWRCSSFMCCNG
uniref:Uncharacterized protein n=1 Tax=Triticum urartu TaxID=4572 RepID=A0A8R7U9L4_TRIUA